MAQFFVFQIRCDNVTLFIRGQGTGIAVSMGYDQAFGNNRTIFPYLFCGDSGFLQKFVKFIGQG